jgi:hypothetical protein
VANSAFQATFSAPDWCERITQTTASGPDSAANVVASIRPAWIAAGSRPALTTIVWSA